MWRATHLIVVVWVSRHEPRTWKVQYYFNELKEFGSHLDIVFSHNLRSPNYMADGLAKLGINIVSLSRYPTCVYVGGVVLAGGRLVQWRT